MAAVELIAAARSRRVPVRGRGRQSLAQVRGDGPGRGGGAGKGEGERPGSTTAGWEAPREIADDSKGSSEDGERAGQADEACVIRLRSARYVPKPVSAENTRPITSRGAALRTHTNTYTVMKPDRAW